MPGNGPENGAIGKTIYPLNWNNSEPLKNCPLMGPSCFTVFLFFKVISLDKSIKEASISSGLSWWFNITSVHHPSQPALTPSEDLKACI